MSKRSRWGVLSALSCACVLMLAVAIASAARPTQDLIVHVVDADGNTISDAQVVVITPEGDHLKTVELSDGRYAYYGVGAKLTLEIEHEDYGTTYIDVLPSREVVRKGPISDGNVIHRRVVLGQVALERTLNAVGPPNDFCENAIPIVVPSVSEGTTTDATFDDVGFCWISNTSPGVWYSVIGTGAPITAETCRGTSWDTKISVFCRSCEDLLCIDGNDDYCDLRSSVTWCSQGGVEYLILVHGYGSATGDFDLTLSDGGVACDPDVTCLLVPENDLCDDAIPVAIPSLTPGTTFGATFDDVGFCGISNTAPGVWYSVLGTGTMITASMCGDFYDYDTKISVFCGACDGLICIDGNDDDCGLLSTVSWCSQLAVEYFILVHGFGGAAGEFEMSLSEDGPLCIPDVGCVTFGACCFPDASCASGMTQSQCEGLGGVYQGDRTLCEGAFLGWSAFEDCTNAFEDISGTGTWLDLGDDDGEVVPLGFMFNFWGDSHVEIGISSNGYLTFGPDLTDFSDDDIPTAEEPNDFIAPLWDDFSPVAGGTVHYQTLGMVPNRRFIAQWTNVPQFGDTDPNTFQAILFEGTNCIELRYGVISQETFPHDFTIGIENQDGTDGFSIARADISEGACKSICPNYTEPVVCVPAVPIDIKPTSCPNPLNTKSNGVLPIAILGTNELDVYDVDPATVTLAGVSPLRWAYEDVATPMSAMADVCDCTDDGPDGYMDMTLKFETQAIVAALGAVTDGEYRPLTLMGEKYDGVGIIGQDCVWIKHKVKDSVPPPEITTWTFDGSSTTIHLNLSQATEVTMVVYDVRGKRVKTVMNGTLPGGDHTVPWNGRDEDGKSVANGMYFCRVKAGSVEKTVKMLLAQ